MNANVALVLLPPSDQKNQILTQVINNPALELPLYLIIISEQYILPVISQDTAKEGMHTKQNYLPDSKLLLW